MSISDCPQPETPIRERAWTDEQLTALHREAFDRFNFFHVGQVWESPRGFLYRVVSVMRGGKATLRLGKDGNGRIIRRDWDAVIGWIIYSDDDEADPRYRDKQEMQA